MTMRVVLLLGAIDPDSLGYLVYKLNNAGPYGAQLGERLLEEAAPDSSEAAALHDQVAALQLDLEAAHSHEEQQSTQRAADLERLTELGQQLETANANNQALQNALALLQGQGQPGG